uniref:uncharacterized protein LOC101242054 isoform X2 n=1 Tax=Ciona intestinalis TaxID=7719 RepID=UPI0005216BFF|nr:uncharacterized protein LOC101242054 isoform X2 [Ciona intestinalis]|eukprot:XP_009860428.1 uncharacterized protein LOC101242054 isoform X2 [Ciona intestinalis]
MGAERKKKRESVHRSQIRKRAEKRRQSQEYELLKKKKESKEKIREPTVKKQKQDKRNQPNSNKRKRKVVKEETQGIVFTKEQHTNKREKRASRVKFSDQKSSNKRKRPNSNKRKRNVVQEETQVAVFSQVQHTDKQTNSSNEKPTNRVKFSELPPKVITTTQSTHDIERMGMVSSHSHNLNEISKTGQLIGFVTILIVLGITSLVVVERLIFLLTCPWQLENEDVLLYFDIDIHSDDVEDDEHYSFKFADDLMYDDFYSTVHTHIPEYALNGTTH